MGSIVENSFDSREDEKGLVGVGVLIVFISIVLVASVAAGILLNTSAALKGQARDTAEKAMNKVSSGVRLIEATGTTNENSVIDNLKLTVQRRVGSQGIDLSGTVLHYKSEDTDAYLRMDNISESTGAYPEEFFSVLGDDNFGVAKIRNESKSENYVLGELSDLCEIQIKSGKVESDKTGLEMKETLNISIMPDVGFKTQIKIKIPSGLGSNQTYKLW